MTVPLRCQAARLEAEGHAMVAEGHAKLAEAARLRALGVEAAGAGDDELVGVPVAAARAATSVRVIREAIRTGALTGYGRQRDRAVRSSDLAAWIESRRAPVASGPDDADMVARIERIARARRRRVREASELEANGADA